MTQSGAVHIVRFIACWIELVFGYNEIDIHGVVACQMDVIVPDVEWLRSPLLCSFVCFLRDGRHINGATEPSTPKAIREVMEILYSITWAFECRISF